MLEITISVVTQMVQRSPGAMSPGPMEKPEKKHVILRYAKVAMFTLVTRLHCMCLEGKMAINDSSSYRFK